MTDLILRLFLTLIVLSMMFAPFAGALWGDAAAGLAIVVSLVSCAIVAIMAIWSD